MASMRPLILLAPALLAIAALAGCVQSGSTTAVLSPSQCDADWAAVGRADGLDGARIGKLEGYKAACARGGAALSEAEETAWRFGWRDGVDALCYADPAALSDDQLDARDYLCGVDIAAAVASSEAEEDPAAREPRYEDDDDGYGGVRVFPTFGIGIGVGSGGVRVGSGIGIGIGYPIY